MGVPTSEVGYIPDMPRREDHEVHKRTCGGIGNKIKICSGYIALSSVLKAILMTQNLAQ